MSGEDEARGGPRWSRGGPPWMHGPGGRPPWWPADQPWPPRGSADGQRVRRRMGRRIACFAMAALFVLGSIGTALVLLILSALGLVESAPFARSASGFGLLLAIVTVVVAVNWLRRLAAPGTRLVEAARRIESGDYSARVPVRGPGELRAVARAMNSMSARLEADEVRRRSVLADVAHELRTPLTIIRGQAEGINDGVYPADAEQMAPILAATRTLEKLVEDLRTSALADSGSLRLQREPVDLAVLVDTALEAFRTTAATAGVRLTVDVADDVPAIEADPVRLNSVAANLVSNALRHSAAGGTVRVSGRRRSSGIEMIVSDDGEGIPAELLPRVFDRFAKGRASTGSGLGLAIVRDVVEAHGGSVAIESAPGHGTTVHVLLPLRPPEETDTAPDGETAR